MRFALNYDINVDDSIRKELARPFGRIGNEETIANDIGRKKRIFAVGDVTVATLLKLGYVPKIALFDYKTGRNRTYFSSIKKAFVHPIKVKNPRGTISRQLWIAVGNAARSKRRVGIRVFGEEDLASLACIYFAKRGDLVMYGMRGLGISVIRVDPKIKRYVIGVLKKMAGIGK